MHDNLALFVKVRSGVGVKSNALVGGDGSQVPSDAWVHDAIVYGGRRPLLTFLRPYPVGSGRSGFLNALLTISLRVSGNGRVRYDAIRARGRIPASYYPFPSGPN